MIHHLRIYVLNDSVMSHGNSDSAWQNIHLVNVVQAFLPTRNICKIPAIYLFSFYTMKIILGIFALGCCCLSIFLPFFCIFLEISTLKMHSNSMNLNSSYAFNSFTLRSFLISFVWDISFSLCFACSKVNSISNH